MTISDYDLDVLDALSDVYSTQWSAPTRQVLYAPDGAEFRLDDGLRLLDEYFPELSGTAVPLAAVDEASLACVALRDLQLSDRTMSAGSVARLFFTDVSDRHQLALLDTDPLAYVISLQEELEARPAGLVRVLDQIGEAYEEAYIGQARRPRDFVVRPVRIACQNVIVALGAIAQDSSFDGLSVPAWQTCEVPHVATHEANRALAALTLCDAFSRGGTMEIRFDRSATVKLKDQSLRYLGHPEGRVPASLRRFGRAVGVPLGADDPAAVSPREARELFMAVTPMPDGLRRRVRDATARRGVSPERACYSLLSQVWREVEMDLLLATSEHAASILDGGAHWTDRSQRQQEADACRSALMAGMYYRRLSRRDTAAAEDGVRVVEDAAVGATWTVNDADATITYRLPEPALPPWATGGGLRPTDTLTVVPRTHVTEHDQELVRASIAGGTPAALLVPRDTQLPPLDGTPVLRCPDRLADLDTAVEDKLLTSRISRA